MEYRVKTDMLSGLHNGELLDLHMGGGDGRIYKGSDSGFVIGESIIDRNPDWFEAVEEVKARQYWKAQDEAFPFPEGEVLRINKTTKTRVHYTSINSIAAGCDEKKLLERHARKLSIGEIEEALTKEAEQRGLLKDETELRWDHSRHRTTVSGEFDEVSYDEATDYLIAHDKKGTFLYQEGSWPDIIDQSPDIEINGYKAKFHEDYVQFGCAKIDKRFFLQWNRELNDGGEKKGCGNRRVTGMRVGEGLFSLEQIKEIAEYYE